MDDDDKKIHTAIAISGDITGLHVVTLMQNGVTEHLPIGGHIGDAVAAQPLLARVMDLFRSAAGVTAATAPEAVAAITAEIHPAPVEQPEEEDPPSPPFDGMERFQSNKVVRAGEIVSILTSPFGDGPVGAYVKNADGELVLRHYLRGMTARYMPTIGDFWVVYDDGYQSISPRQPFVEGYVAMPPTSISAPDNRGGTMGPGGAVVPDQPAPPVSTPAPAAPAGVIEPPPGATVPPAAVVAEAVPAAPQEAVTQPPVQGASPGPAPAAAMDPAAAVGQPGTV